VTVDGPRLLHEVQQLARFGISEWDLRTGDITWSDEQYRIYGLDPGAVPPSLETLLACVYPADVSRVQRGFERARRGHTDSAIEHRILRPSGELRTVQVRALVNLDDRGLPRRMMCTTADITEHKETAARLVFSDRMASVGTLAAGVAHEINNPLAFISANLELIHEGLGSPAPNEIATMLAETRQGVARIQNIVRGLMAFARTDADRRSPLHVESVLELALLMASSEIRHRAEVIREYGTLPPVLANQAQLGQVFLNLLVNAAQAIPEGHAASHRISIATRCDEAGWAIIEISDTGHGIPRDVQGRIFDPFFTTKSIGEGTGLGLSICLGIVRSLGGDIGFTSAPGAGSVFRVALPPAAAPTAPPPAATPSHPPAQPITHPSLAKVLIVDDEVIFANALRRLLARDNYALTLVHDGKQAIARVRAGERFDAILCDLMMPAITGMEVHAELAALAPEQAARMIFLTGGAFSSSAKQFVDRIENLCFEKPCDLDALRAAISRMTKS
jgi:signal transduction histidine kinase/CheY-like chemotaxis protein